MASLLKLYSLLLEQINSPEAIKKAELQELLDECWKYSQQIEADHNNMMAHFDRGFVRYKLDLFEDAIKDLNEAIRIAPDFLPAYYIRGMAKIDSGKLDESITDLDKVIKDMEDNKKFDDLIYIELKAEVHYNRCFLKKQFGDYTGAKEDFKKAISLNPNVVDLFQHMQRCREFGMQEEAEKDLAIFKEEIEKFKAEYYKTHKKVEEK